MKKLAIAKDLTLPVDAITQTFLVVGKRGSGKSNTAARLVEQFHHAGLPFVVLDPTDTWYGVRSSRDGSGPGLDNVYVFGGRKADLPLEATAGALIAEVLCEHRISMVLSVKHLSGRERSAFMVAFAMTLFQKWTGGPLHVVLEEAHELAPQMSGSRGNDQNTNNEAAMLGAFKRLWKLGRSSGIGGTAVTQRPASLSKDITTQSEILIAHRTIGPQDVKAIGEWVKYHGQHEQILGELPTLPTGEAFVWAPEFPSDKPIGLRRTTVLLRDTYDSASTPKVGEQRVEPKQLADVDIDRLRSKMAKTIEQAQANDPRELKRLLAQASKDAAVSTKRISELEGQISRTSSFAPSNEGKKEEVAALTDADRALLEKVATRLDEVRADARKTLDTIELVLATRVTEAVTGSLDGSRDRVKITLKAVDELLNAASVKQLLEKLNGLAVISTSPVARPAPQVPAKSASIRHVQTLSPKPQGVSAPAHGDVQLKKGARDILNALAARHPVPMKWSQLALLCGIKARGSTMSSYMSNLRTQGLISESGDDIGVTATGLDYFGDAGPAALQSKAELIAVWSRRLKKGARAILDDLDRRYPAYRSKDELSSDVLGIDAGGSTLSSYLSNLRVAGLIEEDGDGRVRLHSDLEGR